MNDSRRRPHIKNALHPRNRHPGRYDFVALTQASPDLKPFVARTAYGELSIDFSDLKAVRALNRALLALHYGIREWEIPSEFLCPPIPGRADYIHSVADLLAECNGGQIPRGDAIRCLDIGVGSSCIYPLIGHGEYGWSFVGSDIDLTALESARKILQANPKFASAIELRKQESNTVFFRGIVQPQERFTLMVCNPPFHESPEAAAAGSHRKWENLGRYEGIPRSKMPKPELNFGGKGNELWYPGGELGFIRRMIDESRAYQNRVLWFTSLVSKQTNLPALENAIIQAGTADRMLIPMGQGQKKSRIIAWSFQDKKQQETWMSQTLRP